MHDGENLTTGRVTPAVGGVIFKGDRVLLIQRGRAPLKGHWSIPGGKIDYGEPLRETLRREIREETNVEIEILGLIDAFEAMPEREGDGHYVMIDFACRWVSGEVEAGDDAMDAGFFPIPEALARVAWDDTRLAIQRALPYVDAARAKE